MTKKSIISKFTMAIIIVIVFSSYTMAESVYAQSTKPSAPKFTIIFLNNSTLQLVIENQIFTNSSAVNALVYYFRDKDHSSEVWLLYGNYQLQSNTENTLMEMRIDPLYFPDVEKHIALKSNATLLDFQVQSTNWLLRCNKKPGPPALISPAPQDWHTEITFNKAETSDWSNTQTINLNQIPTTTTPTVPEFPTALTITVLVVVTVALVVVGKRKNRLRDRL